jgi:hypothetical protein
MTHQALIPECRPRGEKEPGALEVINVDRNAVVERRFVVENLRLQIARWVNEGGAGDDETTPPAPERLESSSKQ